MAEMLRISATQHLIYLGHFDDTSYDTYSPGLSTLMAETAANFYLTSDSSPSIFEVIAQNSLNVTLRPALKKLTEFFAASSPNWCGWLNQHYDEVFLLFNGLLQYHYLKNQNASFSEHFYGLKRVRLDDYEITKYQRCLSWTYLVVLPYLKGKIEEKLNEYRILHAEHVLSNDKNGKFKAFLLYFQSTFEITWSSWTLLNYLRYMSKETDSQLPVLQLLNLKLTYSETKDDFYTFWTSLLKGNLTLPTLFQNTVRSILEISAFFVQFLQAWNAEKAHFSVTALPTVQPIELDRQARNYKEKCPICLQYWKIPTVLPVSGYVFCFPCILRHLREHQKCPVTALPAKPLDIVRLY